MNELVKYRLESSQERLDASLLLLQNGFFKDSISKSYYAIFTAVRVVLANDEVDFSKHAGVISYFQKNYVKTGVFDKRYSKFLSDAFRIRNSSDYDDFFIASRSDAEEQLQHARLMLEAVKKYLTK